MSRRRKSRKHPRARARTARPAAPKTLPTRSFAPASAKRTTAALALLFAFTAAFFAFSLDARKDGIADYLHGQPVSWMGPASTVLFANNWLREGAVATRFTMLLQPPSAEYPTFASRDPYISYPPGAVLPVWALSKIAGVQAGPGIVLSYSLANQFLMAFLVAAALLLFLLRQNFSVWHAAFLACIPPGLLLSSHGLLAIITWTWSDYVVLLPAAMYLFLETARDATDDAKLRRAIGITQAALMFFGVLTDYFFLCVAAVVWALRLLRRQSGKTVLAMLRATLLFWMPAAVALALFAAQLQWLNLWPQLFERMTSRMSISAQGHNEMGDFFARFWLEHIPYFYDAAGVWLLWGGLFLLGVGAAFAWIKLPVNSLSQTDAANDDGFMRALAFVAMWLLPCFLQVYLLRNHSAVHHIAAMKFQFAWSLLPVVAPLIIGGIVARLLHITGGVRAAGNCLQFMRGNIAQTILALAVLPWMLWNVAQLDTDALVQELRGQTFANHHPTLVQDAAFLKQHTDYSDVVFSPTFHIGYDHNGFKQLAYTMKRVHRANNTADISRVVAAIDGDFRVNVFLTGGRVLAEYPELAALQSNATEIRDGSYALYKVDGAEFRKHASP